MSTPRNRFGVRPAYDESVLSPEQADAMAVVYGLHLTVTDAADRLGVPVSEVHRLVTAAHDRLTADSA